MSKQSPVLLMTFNRPEQTRRVLEAIALVKPERLYISSDGPRENVVGEGQKVAECRLLIEQLIDWDCQLNTKFNDVNLGCGKAPAEAISWFFSYEDEGIILEDDCLPSQDFFKFCSQMLEKYRDDKRVMTVAGYNMHPDRFCFDTESYFFSNFGFCWGWASWRRAWAEFDFNMQKWPSFQNRGYASMYPFFAKRNAEFSMVCGGKTDVWDYQWSFAIASNSGLSVIPRVSLIQNIGFGSDATHTKVVDPLRSAVIASALTFPLVHPEFVFPNALYEQELLKSVAWYRRLPGVWRRIRRLIRL